MVHHLALFLAAYCQCVLAFSPGPGAEPLLWVGRTPGTIVSPVGNDGFGWDAIFIPENKSKPLGAMPLEEKNRISYRARALAQFIEHCRENEGEIADEIMDRAADW